MMHRSLSRHLKVLRVERGLTLREAEKVTGVDKDTLSRVERGERHPQDVTLAKIAQGYGVPLDELLDLEESAPPLLAPTPESVERRLSLLAQAVVDAADGWVRMVMKPGVDRGMALAVARSAAELDGAVADQIVDGGLEKLLYAEAKEVMVVTDKLRRVMSALVARYNELDDAAQQERTAREQERAARQSRELMREWTERASLF